VTNNLSTGICIWDLVLLGRLLRVDLITLQGVWNSVSRYFHTYVRTSVHPQKVFLQFQWNLVCRLMSDARRYAMWPDPIARSRSRGFWSSKNCTFLSLSPPPFTMGAGKWPLTLKNRAQYLNLIRPDFWYLSQFLCHATLKLEGSLMHSGVLVKVTTAWKSLKRSRPSVPHRTNFPGQNWRFLPQQFLRFCISKSKWDRNLTPSVQCVILVHQKNFKFPVYQFPFNDEAKFGVLEQAHGPWCTLMCQISSRSVYYGRPM